MVHNYMGAYFKPDDGFLVYDKVVFDLKGDDNEAQQAHAEHMKTLAQKYARYVTLYAYGSLGSCNMQNAGNMRIAQTSSLDVD